MSPEPIEAQREWVRRSVGLLPACLWAGLIYWGSSQSRLPALLPFFLGADKLVHACIYAVLASLLLVGAGSPTGPRAWGWALVATLYGATDELHQSFVPSRSADGLDLLADGLGAFLGVALWLKYGRWLRRSPVLVTRSLVRPGHGTRGAARPDA